MRQILISQNPWETLENCRLVRVIDMLLQLITALSAQFPHQCVENSKNVEIMALCRSTVEDRLHHGASCVLNRRHWVCDNERAKRSPADDDKFPRLPNNGKMSTHRGEAAKDAA